MRMLELKIPPPLVAILVAIAMWFVARVGPSVQLPPSVWTSAFVIIALVGGATAAAGDLAFKRARTTINPIRPEKATALVTAGIYRFTRNPMYLGLALVLLGWAAFVGSLLALAGPIAFVLYIDRFQIAPEERVLLAKFGSAYAEYEARVRRWL